MLRNFSDYLFEMLSWCKLNCLYLNYKFVKIHEPIVNKKNESLKEGNWMDDGFGDFEIIH